MLEMAFCGARPLTSHNICKLSCYQTHFSWFLIIIRQVIRLSKSIQTNRGDVPRTYFVRVVAERLCSFRRAHSPTPPAFFKPLNGQAISLFPLLPQPALLLKLSRGRVTATRKAHNLEIEGSTPSPAIMGLTDDWIISHLLLIRSGAG